MTRLAILTTHPVQYYAPLFREIADRIDLTVYYAHRATPEQQAASGFGTAFDWDVDLLSGYPHRFLRNVASSPNASAYAGCDAPEIGERLGEGGFDGLMTLGWHVKALHQGIWAAKRMGLPVMVRGDSQLGMRTGRFRRAAKALLYPSLLRVFDAVLAVGQRNREYFRHYGYPGERIVSSPHAVDTETFGRGASGGARKQMRDRLGVAEDVPIVLFCGKLVPFKRPGDVLEAVASLRSNGLGAEMLMAGSGELETHLQIRAEQLGVPLHALGFVNQSRMPEVYASADVLVLPSTGRETWGLVANEALACGRPVVLSDAVGSAPDLGDGVAGRL
ncbi:MAG: glycosyltransferase family 4 protein, partial [Pseudomonadota bacterium]